MSRARAAAIAALLLGLTAVLLAGRLADGPEQHTSALRPARREGGTAASGRAERTEGSQEGREGEPEEGAGEGPREDVQREPTLTRGEILEEADLLLDREGEIEELVERLASCFEEWETQRESLASMREEIARARGALEQTPRETLEGASEALSGRLELWHTRLDEVKRSADRWPHQEGCE